MAERMVAVFVNMSQNNPKTQESMQKKLEEWRNGKQQTDQLKPKTTPLKPPNRETTSSTHEKTNINSLKTTVSSRPSSIRKPKENAGDGKKRKSVATTTVKTATADECKGKTSTNKPARHENSKISQTDEMAFNENPPSNFEIIEGEPDAKKARRSTFTIDSPKPECNVQETVKPSVRKNLEAWRMEKSKLQAKTNKNSRLHRATSTRPTTLNPRVTASKPMATASKPMATAYNPRATASNRRATASSTRLTTSNPRGWATASNLRATASNPRATASKPRAIASNPRATASKPRATASNPRATASNPRATASSTRPTTSNPKATASNPLQKNIKTFPKKTEIRRHSCVNKPPNKLVQTPKPLHPPKQRNLQKTPSVKTPVYMDKSLSTRERLELWRKEKRKTMPGKFPKTPSTLRKGTKPKQVNKDSMGAKDLEPVKVQPSEMMDDDVNGKETTLEEINEEKETTPDDLKMEVKKKLHDCLIKVKADEKSLDEISCQLDEIQKEHPSAIHCAEFWISRAKIAEHSGDYGRVVCLFEQASAFSAEPASLIEDEFSAYSLRRNSTEEQTACSQDVTSPEVQFNQSHGVPVPPKHPVTPYRAGHTNEIRSPSSIIRYSVTKGTPYRSRLKTSERPTVTPVRRSIRLERRSVNYPMLLQEHGLIVKHLDELPQDIKEEVSFRPNFAVESELNDAWKEIMDC